MTIRSLTGRSLIAIQLLISITGFLQLAAEPATAQNKTSAKIVSLLESSGYSYTKAADTVWTVPFEGKALSKFNVIASTEQEVLVLFVIVAEAKNLRVTPDLMRSLLKLNSDLDRVKIGIDKDGDAFVRVDLSIRILDAEELKSNIEQVAAAADEVYKVVRPFITASK